MGRKTFESIGQPLKDRVNIVLSTTEDPPKGVITVPTKEAVFTLLKEQEKEPFDTRAFIIGGASVYEQFLHDVSHIHMTQFQAQALADTYFPILDENEWDLIQEEYFNQDDLMSMRFLTYKRKGLLSSSSSNVTEEQDT